MKPIVLVVEDDRRIAELVAKNLEAAGFECRLEHEGSNVASMVEEIQPSLIVLDIMLPGPDGLEITRRVRRRSHIPILMLTARSEEADKVLGFELGADDYLTKPFSTRELVARVRALVRRALRDDRDRGRAREPGIRHGVEDHRASRPRRRGQPDRRLHPLHQPIYNRLRLPPTRTTQQNHLPGLTIMDVYQILPTPKRPRRAPARPGRRRWYPDRQV